MFLPNDVHTLKDFMIWLLCQLFGFIVVGGIAFIVMELTK